MLLQNKETGTTVEVLDVKKLIDPTEAEITGQVQEGQEEQDPEPIAKTNLIFPSGEDLPRFWLDANYRLN